MSNHIDIILMGATSFVGKITAMRMAQQQQEKAESFTWAIAGRSAEKLEKLKGSILEKYPDSVFDSVIVDSMKESDMTKIAELSKVVISTVGPYDLYGECLVKACAEQGTHYCDLAGEPQFIAQMIDTYEAQAKASGACIVNCCGFDSIPSDLGAFYLQQQSKEILGEVCPAVDMRLKRMSGTFSGGTIASMLNIIKNAAKDKQLRRVLMNPYAFGPNKKGIKQRFVNGVEQDSHTDSWMAPFLMASINTKVVMRTAQLSPELFPVDFKYEEAMLTGEGRKGRSRAKSMARGSSMLTIGAAIAPLRWILAKFFLPKSGQGPSEEQQVNGFFVVTHTGTTANGKKLTIEVEGDQDPGYGSTAKMLSQSALALLNDLPDNQIGGFWTPASLLSTSLFERLPKSAGVTFKVVDR